MTAFQVQHEDIARLTSTQLPDLLHLLLLIEAKSNGLSTTNVMVPLDITVPDGGEDGRIEWIGVPDSMQNIPSKLTMFQIKAEKSMNATDFMNANFVSPLPAQEKSKRSTTAPNNANKRKTTAAGKAGSKIVPGLKPQVIDVLNKGGAYIFFYSQPLTQTALTKRLDAVREALRLAKRKDWKTAHIDIYDANKIRDWVNQHFSAVAQVCEWCDRKIPFAVQNWQSWSLYDYHAMFKDYVGDETQNTRIEQLRLHLTKPKSIARILGNPGLGKSRMALQALSSPRELRESVVYIDAALPISDLPGSIRQFRDRGDTATIVIDNCSLELHKQIRNEVLHQNSQLSLLTIDFDPGEETGTQGSEVLLFASPMDDKSIGAMLTQVFGKTLPPTALDKVVEFAEGYPGMAALIAQDLVDGKVDAGRLRDGDLLKRLLWGRKAPSDEAYSAIAGCSLFERVGFEDEVDIERKFVAKQFSGIKDEKFYGHIQDFVKRRIVQMRGDFVIVVPSPLAARLAAEWWEKCPRDRAKKLITSKMPGGLAKALCEQVKRLHDLPKVQEITRILCGDRGPFSRAEVLNTEEGSLLFRAFCEVSPIDCISAMELAFSEWTRDDLINVRAGRRNLVWSLEKLCFWDSTFSQSAQMLLRFAAAENETWGNNATGQFVQLYQLYLPGTQAALDARADILESAASDEYTSKVITKAAERAFNLGHLTRMGGVEKQGGRPAQADYVPKTGEEVISYWSRCLNILVDIACNHDAARAEALKAIEHAIFYCVQKHFLLELHDAIKRITECLNIHWYEARQNLDFAMKNSGAKFNRSERATIKQMYCLLEPQSLEQKLKMWVTDVSWDYVRVNKTGEIVDDSQKELLKLVDDCMTDFGQLRRLVPILLDSQGQQRNSFEFGKQLAERAAQDRDTLISDCIKVFKLKKDGSANTAFFNGVLATIAIESRSSVTDLLDQFAQDPELRRYVTRLTTVLQPDERDLARCLTLLNDPQVPVQSMVILSYGKAMDALPPDAVSSFCTNLMNHSTVGAWTGLMILHQYCFQSAEKWKACSSAFRSLVLRINIAERQEEFDSVMATYTWHETSEKLLMQRFDSELAVHIVEQMIGVCAVSDDNRLFYKFDRTFKKMLPNLLSEPYLPVVWPVIETALCTSDRLLKLHVEWLVGDHMHMDNEGPSPLFTLPDEYLLGWSRKNKDAATVLARSAPLFVSEDATEPEAEENIDDLAQALTSRTKINPLLLKLVDDHGGDENFLRALSLNIHSFGGWGSNTQRYKARVELLEPLAKHKLTKVRQWAAKELDFLQKQLLRSQKIDDEHAGGIWERF